jgi:hypothetical protein
MHPAHWEQLRHEEGPGCDRSPTHHGRGLPGWRWPRLRRLRAAYSSSGAGSARRTSRQRRRPGAGDRRLADAAAFAAHSFAFNEADGQVAVADWAEHGDALVERGPWDAVLAGDAFYTAANVQTALRLFPALVEPGGQIRLADPGRAEPATSSRRRDTASRCTRPRPAR